MSLIEKAQLFWLTQQFEKRLAFRAMGMISSFRPPTGFTFASPSEALLSSVQPKNAPLRQKLAPDVQCLGINLSVSVFRAQRHNLLLRPQRGESWRNDFREVVADFDLMNQVPKMTHYFLNIAAF